MPPLDPDDDPPAARLDEYDKDEYHQIVKRLLPTITEAAFDAMWEEFQDAKAAHYRSLRLN